MHVRSVWIFIYGDVLSFTDIAGYLLVCYKATVEINLGLGEGAPAHIGVAAARRHGPTLAIELSRFFEVAYIWPMQLAAWRRVLTLAIPIGHPRHRAHSSEECPSPWVRPKGASTQRPSSQLQSYQRRRDRVREDMSQLRQLRWRSAKANGMLRLLFRCVEAHLAVTARFQVNSSLGFSLKSSSAIFDCLVILKFELMKFDIPVGRIRNRRDVYQSLSTFQEIPQEA